MSCLKDDELYEFCELIGAKKGEDVEKTCQNIIAKIKKTPTCIKKSDLVNLAHTLGVDKSGTKEDIIKRLGTTPGKRKVSLVSEKEETKIVQKSIRQNVIEEKTESCLVYVDVLGNTRHLTIIRVPKQYFNNKGQWLPEGRYMKWNTCKSCAFYISTGTSNEGKNFPGMWFPFMRAKETTKGEMMRGWLEKAYGLEGSEVLRSLNKQFGIKITEFLMVFFEKFSYWWQVSMSAALPSHPDSLWNTHPELRDIKIIALENTYASFDRKFIKSQNVQVYHVPECVVKATTPEDINRWLGSYNSLCYAEDSGM